MEKKVCTKCGNEKPIEEFNWKNKKLNIRKSRCKKCTQEDDKSKYISDNNRRDNLRKTAITRNKWNREYIQRLKKRFSCSKCGENRWYVLDFHHLENKKFEISNMLRAGYSINRIKEEIRKCIVLCANCHREEHFINGY